MQSYSIWVQQNFICRRQKCYSASEQWSHSLSCSLMGTDRKVSSWAFFFGRLWVWRAPWRQFFVKQIWMEMDELVYQSFKTWCAKQALGLETMMTMMSTCSSTDVTTEKPHCHARTKWWWFTENPCSIVIESTSCLGQRNSLVIRV